MTFEQGPLWGGSKVYSMNYTSQLASAFSNFVNNAPKDDLAHLYLAFAYAEEFGGFFATTGPTYGLPISNASIFQELDRIPVLFDATGVNNMTALSIALNQTTFSRETCVLSSRRN